MTTLKTPHPHAALIKQWADDISQPVWFWIAGEWERTGWPSWYANDHYALGDKPTSPPKRMCVLAGVEFPAPETEAPRSHQSYWAADLFATTEYEWDGDMFDYNRLETGLVHLTREAAQQHAKALLAANKAAVSTKE